jgi:hypothetical protein
MVVSAVGQNDHSTIGTIVTSTAVGAGAGYALKYLYPVTKQEDEFNKKVMTNYCHKITNRAKAKEFNEMGVKTKAQDCFVKMIESGDKDAFQYDKLAKRVESLGGENSIAGKEFRGIIRTVNEASAQMLKRWNTAYHMMLKIKRPVIPFLVAGSGIGFLAGFTHNVLKTDA